MDTLHLTSVVLKQRRLNLGLTQAELAARAGIEQSQVSKIERNLDVRLSTLTRLLTALDVDLLLAPRTRTGAVVGTIEATHPLPRMEMREARGQPPHFDTPFQYPTGRDYPNPSTSDPFRPKTGTLLDRFAISDDDNNTKPMPSRPRSSLPRARSPRLASRPPRPRKK